MKESPQQYDAKQLQRISEMEAMFDRSRAAMDQLLAAAEAYLALQPQMQALTAYYESPQWLADFDADRAGRIPQDMKRGILTEDAIYDLLTDRPRLCVLLREIMTQGE